MEIAVLKCTDYEDLWMYLEKIKALGEAVRFIMNNDEPADDRTRDLFGMIIIDYAEAITNILNSMDDLHKIIHNGGASLLSELEKTKKDIESGALGHYVNLDLAVGATKKIDYFLDNDFKQITRLKNEFQNIGADMAEKIKADRQKKAHTTVSAALGA